ncbi:hypothetical protein GN956_G17166 [Arapaima gigas]
MTEKKSKTGDFLKEASLLYKDICPEQARFLISVFISNPGKTHVKEAVCPFCFEWRQPDNHHVRLRSWRRPSPLVNQLLRREAARRHLSLQQAKVLRKFRQSCNTLMATCHTCNRTSRQRGLSREAVAALSQNQRTPGASCKYGTPARTPQSNSRANVALLKSSEKTPSTTPSSKPSSMKKSALSRLKKFLMLEDNQKTQKGSLKDFLSSL